MNDNILSLSASDHQDKVLTGKGSGEKSYFFILASGET